jgi:hypothetical protein
MTSAAKAAIKGLNYRSGKPLRHPKARVQSSVSGFGMAEAMPFQCTLRKLSVGQLIQIAVSSTVRGARGVGRRRLPGRDG